MVERSISASDINELKARIVLLEGDRKAYYESTQWTIKHNRETIGDRRLQNTELRKKLKDAFESDDHVINSALEQVPVIRASMKNRTGDQAISRMDCMVSDSEKRLNQLRHMRQIREARVAELQLQYRHMLIDESVIKQAESADAGKEDEERRGVENRLEKAHVKLQEAEHIARTYVQILTKLRAEAEVYPARIERMEADLKRANSEIEELRRIHKAASSARDAAQTELKLAEESLASSRKRREEDLQIYQAQADERQKHHERAERAVQIRAPAGDQARGQGGGGGDDGDGRSLADEAQNEKVRTLEEAFEKIKDATGVADMKEVIQRFMGQDDTRTYLEELKATNEKTIGRLKEELQRYRDEYEHKKYSGESKMSHGQHLLEEMKNYVHQQEEAVDDAQKKYLRYSKTLMDMKTGVELLSERLKHIKITKTGIATAKIDPSSNEYVLDLLSNCEERLVKLMDDLVGHNEEDLAKEMLEEEFAATLEGNLPPTNLRIRMAGLTKTQLYEEEDDAEDAVGNESAARALIKRQARELIEQKTRKAATTKKKKK